MIICKLIGHRLTFQPEVPYDDRLFCTRCGDSMKFQDSKPLFQENVKGKSQFLESFPFKEKFKKAKKITDILK